MTGCARVVRYWSAIQRNPHAAQVLEEMQRGLEARRNRRRGEAGVAANKIKKTAGAGAAHVSGTAASIVCP